MSVKMTECDIYPNLKATPLSNQQQFRLSKINKIKYYLVAGIIERDLMRKDLVIILFILTILTSH